MNDPQVELLRYSIVLEDEHVRLHDHARLRVEVRGFDCELAGLELTARPTGQFATEEDARQAFERRSMLGSYRPS